MEIKQIHEPALPIREDFFGSQFRFAFYESCMDAPMWIPAGSCRRVETQIILGYKIARPLQREHRRHEWR